VGNLRTTTTTTVKILLTYFTHRSSCVPIHGPLSDCWANALTATAPTKSSIQASACRQLSLNKSVALHAINTKKCHFDLAKRMQ